MFAVKEDLIGQLRAAPEGADTDLLMTFDFVIRSDAVAQAAE